MPTPRFSPQDPAFIADPYPTYARLRREAPIFYYEPWDKWILTAYEDVNALLRDKRLGRVMRNERVVQNPAHAPFDAVQEGSLLELEPPDHTRVRGAVHAAFTPRHVRGLEARVERLCERLAAGLLEIKTREADLLETFAEPLPVTVIADLLGVPERDRHHLLPWSKAIIGMFEPLRTPEAEARAVAAAGAFAAYVRGLMEQKRAAPGDDLVSRMVALHDADPDALSEREVVANCVLFLNAGHEAVVNVIGNGLRALLTHPEALASVRESPALIPTAVEEMMRFDTPLQFFERFVLEDFIHKGHHWKRGAKLCLFYAAANRDPAVFARPDTFDVNRDPNPHLAFGLGLHYCIGAPLARLELQTALRVLLTRLPNLRLAEGRLEYEPKNVFRYLKELRVTY